MAVPTSLPARSRETGNLSLPLSPTADKASLLGRGSLVKPEGRKRLLVGFACQSQEGSRSELVVPL